MPMTEKLQKALMSSNATVDQIADMLRRDGLNCRDSVSLDTPLILATRANNFHVVQHILLLAKKSSDKNNILHAKNKLQESALNEALKIPHDKKIALLLLKNGIDPLIGISAELSPEIRQWLNPFIEYPKQSEINHKAAIEFELGSRYFRDLNDMEEAIKWFELAANNGHKQSMLNVALYCKQQGKLLDAINWYKKSYFLCLDNKQKESIIIQLKNIANEHHDDSVTNYQSHMVLGSLYCDLGDTSSALHYFKKAGEYYFSLSEKSANEELFFQACYLWDGPCREKNLLFLDYLNLSKRFELLLQSKTQEGKLLIKAFVLSPESKLLQLIACYVSQENKLFDKSLLSPLVAQANAPLLQALSSLYGWNGQPKNVLRAASQFKKILETSKSQDPEIAYLSCVLMAYAYFQQEKERDIYIAEAFKALDQAHASLHKSKSSHRNEIIRVIVDGVDYAK